MNTQMHNAQIFTGNANPVLASRLAKVLNVELGQATIETFSDGEIGCEIKSHVRGEKVFVVQPTCYPTNNNLMELLLLGDALRRSDVDHMTAVIPYYGYARQDRRPGYSRTPITSRLVADMIVAGGYNKVITIDIHSAQQQGFFPNHVPMFNTSASPEIIGDIWNKFGGAIDANELVVVSPDVGGVARAREVAKRLDNAELAIIDKRRQVANQSEVMNLIGNVEDKDCVLVDDMCDTAGTLCKAANALKVRGARSVTSYATHGVLSGSAYTNILDSQLDELVVTDTIPLAAEIDVNARKCLTSGKIRILSIAALLAETMRRTHANQSVSEIYTG
jgi:ribose-phosphate pyrophosphokinase